MTETTICGVNGCDNPATRTLKWGAGLCHVMHICEPHKHGVLPEGSDKAVRGPKERKR